MTKRVLEDATPVGVSAPGAPVTVARVIKPTGLRGSVRVESLSDVPDRFRVGARLWVMTRPPVRVTLAAVAEGPGHTLVLRFRGRSSVDDVQGWRGCFMAIDESERAALPDGMYFHDELAGMDVVTESEHDVGTVRDVWSTGPHDVLVIDDGGTERLLPVVKAFVLRVDRAQRRITVRPPNGWLDDVAM